MVFADLLRRLAGSGLNIWALAQMYFFWSLPVLLVGMWFVNSWLIVEVLYFRVILSADFAWIFLGIYASLLVNTAGSISYCWWLANFHAKTYRMPTYGSDVPVPRPRTVMQTDFGTSLRFDFELLGTEGHRPNRCDQPCANSARWKGDRMYHCRFGYDLCLPVFDHYCYWLWTPVYLHTIKPYSVFMPLLFVYATFSLGVMSWALRSPYIRGLSRWSYVVLALSCLFSVYAAWINCTFQWNMIVFQNRVGKERGRTWHWTMAIRNINGRLMFDEAGFNPYSMGGRWANAQEVLGKWYQMPFWFWQPARVGQYGCHLNLDNDTTISPAYMIRANGIRHQQMSVMTLDVGILPPSSSSFPADATQG
ncbi:DHHC zinc finger domain-containing protein [Colletotrichum cereale]|nr:DHHC zinc finger domain-containing protein [Colletotrichum cereale]